MTTKTVYEWLNQCENNQFGRVRAYAIFRTGEAESYCGKIQVAYPKDGAGILRVFLWDFGNKIQMGTAGGYGYDKLSAALRGLKFQGITLQDYSPNWETQLKDAGYTLIQVV